MCNNNLTTGRATKRLGAAAALATVPPLSRAVGWRRRPFRRVVPSAAGGSPDAIYRLLGTDLCKSLFAKSPYDPVWQRVPVALLGYVQNAPVVRNDLGVNSVQELIAPAKAKPGQLTLGAAGTGAIADLLDRKIDLMFDNLSSISLHIFMGWRCQALRRHME